MLRAVKNRADGDSHGFFKEETLMGQFLGVILLFVLFSSLSFAQKNASTSANPEGQSTTTINASPDIFSNPSLMGGMKAYNDVGRAQQTAPAGSRQFISKDEFFLGVRTQGGFGLFGQVVQDFKNYSPGGKKLTGFYTDDPSISFLHPIYTSDRLIITGLAREYFPASAWAVGGNIYEQAYYLNIVYKMKGGYDLFNQLISRYFSATNYVPSDSVFYEEYTTTLSKLLGRSVRVGLGQQTQVETHNDTPVGKTLEIFPYADFLISKTIFAGPRVYIPVAAQNSVYDAPIGVSISNVMAEFYLQATL